MILLLVLFGRLITIVTITRSKIIEAARDWIGTPWRHHQRNKTKGCDCVQFILGVGKELGHPIPEFPNYYRSPEGDELLFKLELVLEKIDPKEALPGDVLVFKNTFKGLPHHVGFLSYNNKLIHADQRAGRVVEVNIGYLQRLIVGAYKLRGIQENE